MLRGESGVLLGFTQKMYFRAVRSDICPRGKQLGCSLAKGGCLTAPVLFSEEDARVAGYCSKEVAQHVGAGAKCV